MPALLRFNGATEWDPAVARWFEERQTELGLISQEWFTVLRKQGPDVRELLHDGFHTVCVEDAPFGHVAVFKAHVTVAFFHGASLPDPHRLLEGAGRYMRHVKVRPGQFVHTVALVALIKAAYIDIRSRVRDT